MRQVEGKDESGRDTGTVHCTGVTLFSRAMLWEQEPTVKTHPSKVITKRKVPTNAATS